MKKKQLTRIIICPQCKGSEIMRLSDPFDPEKNGTIHTCNECNGTGRMFRTVTIIDLPYKQTK